MHHENRPARLSSHYHTSLYLEAQGNCKKSCKPSISYLGKMGFRDEGLELKVGPGVLKWKIQRNWGLLGMFGVSGLSK